MPHWNRSRFWLGLCEALHRSGLDDFLAADAIIRQIAESLELSVTITRSGPGFRRFLLISEAEELVVDAASSSRLPQGLTEMNTDRGR